MLVAVAAVRVPNLPQLPAALLPAPDCPELLQVDHMLQVVQNYCSRPQVAGRTELLQVDHMLQVVQNYCR